MSENGNLPYPPLRTRNHKGSGSSPLFDIREAQPDVQVIMVTGEPEVGTAAEAVRKGELVRNPTRSWWSRLGWINHPLIDIELSELRLSFKVVMFCSISSIDVVPPNHELQFI